MSALQGHLPVLGSWQSSGDIAMAIGDRKKARDAFFKNLEAAIDEINYESTIKPHTNVTVITTTDPRDHCVPIAE